jgi:hypothetical protein
MVSTVMQFRRCFEFALTTKKHTFAKKTLGWVRDVKFHLTFSLTLKLFLQDEIVTQNVISFSQSKLWKLFLQDVCRAHAFKWVFASSSSSVVTSLREEDLKNFPFQVEGGREGLTSHRVCQEIEKNVEKGWDHHFSSALSVI